MRPVLLRRGCPKRLTLFGTLIEVRATADLPERDWLFPTILATLLTGSAISFALAWTGRIVQHQELKVSSEHATPRGGAAEPMVLRVHGPSE
jgi:hypothetical protein